MSEINQTIRAEAASSDIYVRRMRPTFGYLMAVTWAAQMLGIAYIMIFETEKAPDVLDAMEALSAIWAIGLSVLGIYVYKRSEEKKVILSPKKEQAPAPEVVKTTNVKPQNPTSVRPKVNE